MNLYYIRHGKTQGNHEKNYIGRMDSPLTEEGIEGAVAAGHKILDDGINFDAIYTSSLERQRKTADIIEQEIGYPVDNIIENDLLLERSGGNFEGKSQKNFFAASEEEQIAAGAESFKELAKRAIDMVEFARQYHAEDTVLFVGSAAIGEMMRAMIKYDDYTKMFDDGPLPNAELIQFI